MIRHNTTRLLRITSALLGLSAVALWAQTATPAASDKALAPTAPSKDSTLVLDKVTITAKRDQRTSTGATNLPLTIKATPQSISVIDQDAMRDFATTDANEALRLGTGLT